MYFIIQTYLLSNNYAQNADTFSVQKYGFFLNLQCFLEFFIFYPAILVNLNLKTLSLQPNKNGTSD